MALRTNDRTLCEELKDHINGLLKEVEETKFENEEYKKLAQETLDKFSNFIEEMDQLERRVEKVEDKVEKVEDKVEQLHQSNINGILLKLQNFKCRFINLTPQITLLKILSKLSY